MSNQAPANIEAAYQEVEGTIKGLAIKYAQKKGIAFEEAISVCHEGFMQAWRKFSRTTSMPSRPAFVSPSGSGAQ